MHVLGKSENNVHHTTQTLTTPGVQAQPLQKVCGTLDRAASQHCSLSNGWGLLFYTESSSQPKEDINPFANSIQDTFNNAACEEVSKDCVLKMKMGRPRCPELIDLGILDQSSKLTKPQFPHQQNGARCHLSHLTRLFSEL